MNEESIEDDKDEMEELIEEKEVKIEEDEGEEGWMIDRGRIENEEGKKEEEDDDGWGDFKGVEGEDTVALFGIDYSPFSPSERVNSIGVICINCLFAVKPESFKKKKKKKRKANDTSGESTVAAITVVEESDGVKKKKKKRKVEVEVVSSQLASSLDIALIRNPQKRKMNQLRRRS